MKKSLTTVFSCRSVSVCSKCDNDGVWLGQYVKNNKKLAVKNGKVEKNSDKSKIENRAKNV